MIIKLRKSAAEPGYWFQLIADSGQILAQSEVFATRAGIDAAVLQILDGAGSAKIVDMTLD